MNKLRPYKKPKRQSKPRWKKLQPCELLKSAILLSIYSTLSWNLLFFISKINNNKIQGTTYYSRFTLQHYAANQVAAALWMIKNTMLVNLELQFIIISFFRKRTVHFSFHTNTEISKADLCGSAHMKCGVLFHAIKCDSFNYWGSSSVLRRLLSGLHRSLLWSQPEWMDNRAPKLQRAFTRRN